jgi:hypothetical protein
MTTFLPVVMTTENLGMTAAYPVFVGPYAGFSIS